MKESFFAVNNLQSHAISLIVQRWKIDEGETAGGLS